MTSSFDARFTIKVEFFLKDDQLTNQRKLMALAALRLYVNKDFNLIINTTTIIMILQLHYVSIHSIKDF